MTTREDRPHVFISEDNLLIEISVGYGRVYIFQAYHAYGIPGRQMLRAGNMVAGKKLIGNFKCDVGTVYSATGKSFECKPIHFFI